MGEVRETCWNHCAGDKVGSFFTGEQKWINKVHKWMEQYPDDVKIVHENDDGSILVHLPLSYFKISPKKRVQMSEEDKCALRDRLAKSRQKTIAVQ